MSQEQPLQGVPNFDKLEVVKVGTASSPLCTITTSGAGWGTNTTVNTYAHGLGYKPIAIGYLIGSVSPNYYYPLNFERTTANFSGTIDFFIISIKIYTDETNVYVSNNTTISTTTAGGLNVTGSGVKYYLLRPKAD